MSTESVDTLEAKFRNDVYTHLVAFAFLYYDHLMTLDDEIRLIWNRPNTLSSHLFLINRYFSFAGNIVVLLSIFFATNCSAWSMFQEIFHALAQVIVAILLTLRIYALYEQNRRILIFLSGLVLTGISLAIATDLLSSATEIPPSFPDFGCHSILDLKNASLVAVGWEALFIYDVLLFGMTLRKAYLARYKSGITRFGGMSLFVVAIRDGTIYYAIMCIFNLLNVLTFYVTGDIFLRAPFASIASCMSVTLMSRLMLHLHQFADQGLYVPQTKTLGLCSRSRSTNSGSDSTCASRLGAGVGYMAEDAVRADEGGHGVALTTFWTNTFDHTGTSGTSTAGAITSSSSATPVIPTGRDHGHTQQAQV